MNIKKNILFLQFSLAFFILFGISFCSYAQDDFNVDLVITRVGFNPVFYPISKNIIPMPKGIKINIKTAGYSQAELFTLSTIDKPLIGILSNVNIGKAFNNGLEFKILAPYYREIPGPENMSMGQLVIKSNSSIKSPTDLYGKKVAIQGLADGSTIALKTVMKNKYSLELSKINFIAIDNEIMPHLLKSGQIDAAMFDSDYIISENFKKDYRTLIDFGMDLKKMYGSVPPAKFFVVKKGLYTKNPEKYNKVIDFFRKNYEWSRKNIKKICLWRASKTGEKFNDLVKKSNYEIRLDKLTKKDLPAIKEFYKTAFNEKIINKIPDIDKLFGTLEK